MWGLTLTPIFWLEGYRSNWDNRINLSDTNYFFILFFDGTDTNYLSYGQLN